MTKTINEKKRCDCGCCHDIDYGACPKSTYEKGMNGRCVYCDHGEECHIYESPWEVLVKSHNIP